MKAMLLIAAVLVAAPAMAHKSKGGHYVGGSGSSHKGGHYVSATGSHHYSHRR